MKKKGISRLDTYLKMDIPQLLQTGDYKTLQEMERYLNIMARQRYTRLKKAGVDINDTRVISKYSLDDFQVSYKGKYKLSNEDLKKYQNKMLKSISKAKHFLNLKSSNVSNFKKWSMSNKKLGIKFKSPEERDEFYSLLNDLWELDENGFGSLASWEQMQITEYLIGRPRNLTIRELKGVQDLADKLSKADSRTKEGKLYSRYFETLILDDEYLKPTDKGE